MFERYTDRARCVIFLSLWSARSRGSSQIEPEDLLQALICEDRRDLGESFPGGDILHRVAPGHQSFFTEAAARSLLHAPDDSATVAQAGKDLPMSDSLKAILKNAARRKHKTTDPLHLLAAITEDRESPLAQRLLQCGISRQRVNEALEKPNRSCAG